MANQLKKRPNDKRRGPRRRRQRQDVPAEVLDQTAVTAEATTEATAAPVESPAVDTAS